MAHLTGCGRFGDAFLAELLVSLIRALRAYRRLPVVAFRLRRRALAAVPLTAWRGWQRPRAAHLNSPSGHMGVRLPGRAQGRSRLLHLPPAGPALYTFCDAYYAAVCSPTRNNTGTYDVTVFFPGFNAGSTGGAMSAWRDAQTGRWRYARISTKTPDATAKH